MVDDDWELADTSDGFLTAASVEDSIPLWPRRLVAEILAAPGNEKLYFKWLSFKSFCRSLVIGEFYKFQKFYILFSKFYVFVLTNVMLSLVNFKLQFLNYIHFKFYLYIIFTEYNNYIKYND